MIIALVQQHAGESIAENARRGLAAMVEAKKKGAEVVAFAELSFLRFFPAARGRRKEAEALAETIPGETTRRFAEKARELELVTLINLYERDGDRCFDTSVVIDADGSILGKTRMLHITDFPGFHERDYYHPGNLQPEVFTTRAGRIGVVICYDRHYPEVMRAFGLARADVVIIPQAGTLGEWPEGIYEGEIRVAAFQNGYFAALVNRVGDEGELVFSGESFVSDPEGRVIARAAAMKDEILVSELDLSLPERSTARRLFLRDL
jgi:N-carbamoylputrescine amidase